MRMALVMVRAGENGAPSVRLVQDFGCPPFPSPPRRHRPTPCPDAAFVAQTRPRPPAGQPDEKACMT